jgi:phosphoglucosamine mutase
VLAEMYDTGKSLGELCADVQKYPQELININLGQQNAQNIMQADTVVAAVRDVEQEMDGQGRVLLRPSGTEPLIRVMVEGRDGKQVMAKAEQIADVVRQFCD